MNRRSFLLRPCRRPCGLKRNNRSRPRLRVAGREKAGCAPTNLIQCKISWNALCESGHLADGYRETGCRMWDWHRPRYGDMEPALAPQAEGRKRVVTMGLSYGRHIDRFEGTLPLWGAAPGSRPLCPGTRTVGTRENTRRTPSRLGNLTYRRASICRRWKNGCSKAAEECVVSGCPAASAGPARGDQDNNQRRDRRKYAFSSTPFHRLARSR